MDYKNGKIYALRSPHTEKVYIGSTTQPLNKRFYVHKAHYNYWKAGKSHYITSFEILQAGDAYIELVKNCPCDSKEELRREEGITIRATENCCNNRVAGRKYQEYDQDNRERINERQRQYNQDNRERINERQRQYRQDNREQISQRNKEKVGCYACKSMVRKRDFKRHERTKKHQDNLSNIIE